MGQHSYTVLEGVRGGPGLKMPACIKKRRFRENRGKLKQSSF